MSRDRYWQLTSDDISKMEYDSNKVLNWDIKCIRKPEESAQFIGVFLYRNGTPIGYDIVKGIVYYHNSIPREELPKITKFLKSKFGGSQKEKGERVFLEGSKEIYSGKEVGELAKQMEENFNTKATITIEFNDLTDEEKSKLPGAKLLPLPTK